VKHARCFDASHRPANIPDAYKRFRPADAADFAYPPARIIKLPGWIIKLPAASTNLAQVSIELASSRRRVAGRSDRFDGEAAARHRPFQFGPDPLGSAPVGEGFPRGRLLWVRRGGLPFHDDESHG